MSDLRELRSRHDQLLGLRRAHEESSRQLAAQVAELDDLLERAEPVRKALESLTEDLFDETLREVGQDLSIALREVFADESLSLVAERTLRRNAIEVDFHVERNGEREDLLRGQGGSVLNVVSTGLRMLALTTQGEEGHRPFLVLDEQDCWLRPDLVPRFMRIVSVAAKKLSLQVLVITHHEPELIAESADKAYKFEPAGDHVRVSEHPLHPAERRRTLAAQGIGERAEPVAAGAMADPTPAGTGLGQTAQDLRQLVEGPLVAAQPLSLPKLEDHGLRAARLAARPSVLQLLCDQGALRLTQASPDAGSVYLSQGVLFVDQARLECTLVCALDSLGAHLRLSGGPDGSLAYELLLPGSVEQALPADPIADPLLARARDADPRWLSERAQALLSQPTPLRAASATALLAAQTSDRSGPLSSEPWLPAWLRDAESGAVRAAQELLALGRALLSHPLPDRARWRDEAQRLVEGRAELELLREWLIPAGSHTGERLTRTLERVDRELAALRDERVSLPSPRRLGISERSPSWWIPA